MITQAARLLSRGQAAHAAQFPATINIAGQSYTAATSGEKRERDLLSGGWLKKASISLWLPLSAFVEAGEPLPTERSSVTLTHIAGVAQSPAIRYIIASTSNDATNTTITLKCETPEQ